MLNKSAACCTFVYCVELSNPLYSGHFNRVTLISPNCFKIRGPNDVHNILYIVRWMYTCTYMYYIIPGDDKSSSLRSFA